MRVTNGALAELSGLMLAEYQKTGKRPLPIAEARRLLEATGYSFGGLTNGHLSRLLRERSLDLRARIEQLKHHAEIARKRSTHTGERAQATIAISHDDASHDAP